MSIPVSKTIPQLTYLNVASYCTPEGHINDYSTTPRPHNCISLFYEGHAFFRYNDEVIEMFPGDLIFVPWQSLYVSQFVAPQTKYLTIHCNFAPSDFVFKSSDYHMQKLKVDFDSMFDDFSFMQKNINSTDMVSLEVMQRFYKVMSVLLPRLKHKQPVSHNETILSVIDYMENHYTEELGCSELAKLAAMSESQFYLMFKKETGLTPVEYKNHIRIRHAVHLLYEDLSIEEITTLLGFNSAVYFRKVFRKSTGCNPLEYKKQILKR